MRNNIQKFNRDSGFIRKTVFVGLSGGVDSSVTALLLQKQGFDVVGVHLRCWNNNGCDIREAEDARRVAEHLSIPFYVFDMEDRYRKRVVDYMITEYKQGRTPNPDVMCNKEIKFGLFLEKARSLHATYIATGHYVRLCNKKSMKTGDIIHTLYKGKDIHKDQSYFLWTLTQEQLKYCLFPIGIYTKSQVRVIARMSGLPTAEKKDSQGICFIGNVTLRDFLHIYLPEKQGEVCTRDGKCIGKHAGVQFYTIGQRHGFTITKRTPDISPHYVVRKEVKTNTLIVAEGSQDAALYRNRIAIHSVHFIDPIFFKRFKIKKVLSVFARVRYGQALAPAVVALADDLRAELIFETPQQFIAAGQSAVFYKKSGEMIGGGIISE
ncbi:MAG: tRNA 2-thiouridine(34) synthase MnmA [bacterium]